MFEYCHKMAKMAQISYYDSEEAKPKFEELGYPHHIFLDIDGAQCHIVWNEEEAVLCFRGTEPKEFSDIKADLNVLPNSLENGGWVHSGFKKEIDKLWLNVKLVLSNVSDRKIYVTGHSLGAAMATIAASRLGDKVECLYTFGSPRVGSRIFVDTLKVRHYRFFNNNDVVTSVPFTIMGYRHHSESIYIDYYGDIKKYSFWQRFKDQLRGRWRALQKGQPFDGVYDHDMRFYIKHTGRIEK